MARFLDLDGEKLNNNNYTFQQHMKQFNVKEFISNEETPVVTRDGKSVRIICTDRKTPNNKYPIIALLNDDDNITEIIEAYQIDGCNIENHTSDIDLFFAPKKCKGWVNVYQLGKDYYTTSDVEWSEEEAKSIAVNDSNYIATIPIEWEE